MFDFLKKSKGNPPSSTDPQPEVGKPAAPGEGTLEPRAHHFTFSQVVVPQVAWRDPMTFFGAVKMDQKRFTQYLLDVNRDVNQKNRDPFRMHAEALSFKTTAVHPWPCILIKMPPPQIIGETALIAVVLLLDPRAKEQDIDPQKGPSIAVFNLDLAEEGTLVGEWRREERLLHRPGPPVSEKAFLHWVSATLAARRI